VRGAPLVLLAWAALVAVHTAVLVAFGGGLLSIALLGGSAAGAALLGLLLAALRRRAGAPRPAPEPSGPAALAAVGLAGLVVGAELGLWLVLVSGGVLAIALAGLVREGRGAAS
jgi:hypothetical protein